MYNGIGLQTPRGSGTNGHVQRNLSCVRPREKVSNYQKNDDLAKLEKSIMKQPNKEILDHERKRKIELKCMELAEILEEEGFNKEVIDIKIENYRKVLQNNEDSKLELPTNQWGKISATETHMSALAQIEKNSRIREAFGISEHFVDGSSFDSDRKAKEKLTKSEMLAASIAEEKRNDGDKSVETKNGKKDKLKSKKKNKDDTSDDKDSDHSRDDKTKKRKKHKRKSSTKSKKEKKKRKKKHRKSSDSSSDESIESSSDESSDSSTSTSSSSSSSSSSSDDRRKKKKFSKKRKHGKKKSKRSDSRSDSSERDKKKRSKKNSKRDDSRKNNEKSETKRNRSSDSLIPSRNIPSVNEKYSPEKHLLSVSKSRSRSITKSLRTKRSRSHSIVDYEKNKKYKRSVSPKESTRYKTTKSQRIIDRSRRSPLPRNGINKRSRSSTNSHHRRMSRSIEKRYPNDSIRRHKSRSRSINRKVSKDKSPSVSVETNHCSFTPPTLFDKYVPNPVVDNDEFQIESISDIKNKLELEKSSSRSRSRSRNRKKNSISKSKSRSRSPVKDKSRQRSVSYSSKSSRTVSRSRSISRSSSSESSTSSSSSSSSSSRSSYSKSSASGRSRSRSRVRSPSIPRRPGSPSFLDRRRITSARKRPIIYRRAYSSDSSDVTSTSSRTSSPFNMKRLP